MPPVTRAAARRKEHLDKLIERGCHLLHLPVELRDIILDYVIVLSDPFTENSFIVHKRKKGSLLNPGDPVRRGGAFAHSPDGRNPRSIHLPGELPPIVNTLRLLAKFPA